MREILFRGKRVDGKGWVEGHFLVSQKADKTWYIVADVLSSELMAIVPESLGQFTGLLDKNGKRIFEGDVLKSGMTGATYIVCFGEYSTKNDIGVGFWKKGIGSTDRGFISDSDSQFIIGNIHDKQEAK